jgi:hypothetical protein
MRKRVFLAGVFLIVSLGMVVHAATISGIVSDSAGSPLNKIAIALKATTGAGGTTFDRDTTDADGAYSITCDSISGTYFVMTTDPAGAYLQQFDSVALDGTDKTVDITMINIKHAPVSGAVTDSVDGTPLAGVIVWRGGRRADTTDADGKYSLDSVSTGTVVSFSATEYVTKTVTPSIGDEAVTLDITLVKKKSCPVSGTVIDSASGAPIEGASVWVNYSPKDTTGEDGKYALDSVIAGAGVIRVSASGYATKSLSVTIIADSALTVDFSLRKAESAVRTTNVAASRSTVIVSADRLVVRSAGEAGVVRLISVKGELVAVQSFPANATTRLELGQRLPADTYILKVSWRNGSLLQRIFVR